MVLPQMLPGSSSCWCALGAVLLMLATPLLVYLFTGNDVMLLGGVSCHPVA